MPVEETPVLIVGGGPVGLTTSILCSYHGVRSLLVEQHPTTSKYPKARFINARTMEIFRQTGIEPTLREVAIPHTRDVVWAYTLAGEELAHRPVETMIPDGVREWSPSWGCTSTQEVFEPVLLAQAQRQEAAEIRFNTQLLTFEQNDDHIVARLLDCPSGREWAVRARYLIGADGAHSSIREALGIRMQGQSVLTHSINILFRANLARFAGDREISLCFITNPPAAGLLLYNGGDRWRFTAFYYPDKGERPEDFTVERCLHVVRTAVGVADLPVELVGIFPWSDAALVAERFGVHRTFLVGDAEHLMAPAGGFGMSVGMQDAHNLVWKLAAVLKGWTKPALLASYEVERAPISRMMTNQMAQNAIAARATNRDSADASSPSSTARPVLGRPEFFREHGLVFGVTYDSPVIIPDGTAPVQVTNPVTDYIPNARPGSRAPHVWLKRAGQHISSLDLFATSFVLLAGAKGRAWCDAALAAADAMSVPLRAHTVGEGGNDLDDADAAGAWAHTYGVEPQGAVLVRPDGYVAWRSRTGSLGGAASFGEILHQVLATSQSR